MIDPNGVQFPFDRWNWHHPADMHKAALKREQSWTRIEPAKRPDWRFHRGRLRRADVRAAGGRDRDLERFGAFRRLIVHDRDTESLRIRTCGRESHVSRTGDIIGAGTGGAIDGRIVNCRLSGLFATAMERQHHRASIFLHLVGGWAECNNWPRAILIDDRHGRRAVCADGCA